LKLGLIARLQYDTHRIFELFLSVGNYLNFDTINGLIQYRFFYRISHDNGKTYGKLKKLIHAGKEFNAHHPLPYIWEGKGAVCPSPTRYFLRKTDDGKILIPYAFYNCGEPNARYYRPQKTVWTNSVASVLIGEWDKEGKDIIFHKGGDIFLTDAQSTRGAEEPVIERLNKKDHYIMIYRAGSSPDREIKGHAWKAISADQCNTWSRISMLTFSDGSPFYSPSSCPGLLLHSSGRLFWIGNISNTLPEDNYPRYPLVIGEIDQKTFGVIKESVYIIDSRDPTTDGPKVQFSNFFLKEENKTGNIIIALTKLDRHNNVNQKYTYVITPMAKKNEK
jgi:hypothetical protein